MAKIARSAESVPLLRNPDTLKRLTVEPNVAAYEAALTALQSILSEVDVAVGKLRAQLISGLVEKGLAGGRATIKAKAQECLLLMTELEQSSDPMLVREWHILF